MTPNQERVGQERKPARTDDHASSSAARGLTRFAFPGDEILTATFSLHGYTRAVRFWRSEAASVIDMLADECRARTTGRFELIQLAQRVREACE